MTAAELLAFEIDNGSMQLNACLDGLTDSQVDDRLTPEGMSIREMLPHLAEACVAACDANEGRKHDWGSYKPGDNSLSGLRADLQRRRDEAKASCTDGGDRGRLIHGFEYLVAHDCYHIGQMALLRLKVDPTWNADSLYS